MIWENIVMGFFKININFQLDRKFQLGCNFQSQEGGGGV